MVEYANQKEFADKFYFSILD